MLRPPDSPQPEPDPSTGDADRGYGVRLGIALAISLCLHEIVAGLWPAQPPPERVQQRVAFETITIARRPRPIATPTPVPTPRMTPAPHYTLAPTIHVRAPAARAAATPHAAIGGAAARKRLAVIRPKPVPPKPAPRLSLADGTQIGRQNGGIGTGAGAGNGTSGLAGNGTGTGTTGTGNGGAKNAAPCGQVILLPGRVDYKPDGTVLQHVYAKVIMRDGDVQLGNFPYPFVYAAERLNPFVHDDQLAADKGIPVQTPPPGFDVSTMPAPVQVVLEYTSGTTGFSTLPDCGDGSPRASSTMPSAKSSP